MTQTTAVRNAQKEVKVECQLWLVKNPSKKTSKENGIRIGIRMTNGTMTVGHGMNRIGIRRSDDDWSGAWSRLDDGWSYWPEDWSWNSQEWWTPEAQVSPNGAASSGANVPQDTAKN